MQLDNTEEAEEEKKGGVMNLARLGGHNKRGRFYLIDSDGWFC
jgi:hypothetical protein